MNTIAGDRKHGGLEGFVSHEGFIYAKKKMVFL